MSVDSCERTVETVEFADVLPCKKSSIRLRSLERPPAITMILITNSHLPKHSQRFVIPVTQQQIALRSIGEYGFIDECG
jgi:hypothetical protein